MTLAKAKTFLSDYRTTFVLWLMLGVVSGIIKAHRGYNNFLIYKYVFWNTLEQNDLYLHYPEKFNDLNHYGPFFSLVIAPYALMPEWLGVILWNVSLAMLLYVAVRTSRFSRYEILFMLWYAAHDLLTCLFMTQFNIAVAALILFSFTMTEQKKDFWAAFFICAGVFVKLLGIVGLAFFFFSRNKTKFILSLCFWSIVMFVLPMLISSPEYVCDQYASWYHALESKNMTNSGSRTTMNNISLVGMVRRIFIDYNYSDLLVIIPGLAIVATGYFRIRQWASPTFRKMVLAQMMLITILFSTGTENSSYVIAYVAIAIWYASVPWKRSRLDLFLLVYAFVFGSLLPTDLFPKSLQTSLIRPYALRALPVTLIWLKLSWEMIRTNYIEREQQKLHII
ncbi:MAG: DUF2029 domain-containing protein [Prevotella sp.]|nr:DUF2029 domain-containing protein [Prevotella sp.]